ncbi:MAG: zinc ribbon domain-containing protein [Planctomycetes bacterium]|nr:zinc ribbon domain-containing protein [Planctomycetota bacterium]
MSTCENCGKSFELQESLAEVTSLRVLCPQCGAERAAAKARKAAVPASGRPAQAKPAAAPAAAPKAPPPSAAQKAAAPAPKSAAPMPAKKLQTRAEAAEAAAKAAPKKAKPEIELASRNLQKRGSRELLIAFAVAVVIFAVAGGVLWMVLDQKKAEQATRDAYSAQVKKFKADFQAFDIETEDGATRLIAFQEEQKPLWKDLDFAGEVVNRTAKAHTNLERREQQQELRRRLEEIEAVMAKAAELKPNELADQLRRLDELKLKVGVLDDPEFWARVDKDCVEGERIHLERLMATAQAAAASEPLDRAALATLAAVEDDVFKLLDSTARALAKDSQNTELNEKKKDFETRYRTVMKLADDAVERFFTAEVIEATPWRDLLSDPSAWKAAEAKGFEHNIVNGTLTMIGPDPDADGQGVMSIGDREIWRDFVIEVEVTIEKGMVECFFRLPINWQKNVEYYDLTTDEGELEAGRTYALEFRALGSTLTITNKTEDTQRPENKPISWIQIRKGAFGLSVPNKTEIKFTKMRGKVLR